MREKERCAIKVMIDDSLVEWSVVVGPRLFVAQDISRQDTSTGWLRVNHIKLLPMAVQNNAFFESILNSFERTIRASQLLNWGKRRTVASQMTPVRFKAVSKVAFKLWRRVGRSQR